MMTLRHSVRQMIRRLGCDVRQYHPRFDQLARLLAALERHRIGVVFDIGANVGQFARLLRAGGFRGRIVSFEPCSDAHGKLTTAAAGDRSWIVAPRCALGARLAEVKLNIAGNSESSSVLGMLDRHVAGAPASAYVDSEIVPMTTLDVFIDGAPELASGPLALKIDTQGYEGEVIAGLSKWSGAVKLIMTEMSLAPLYRDQVNFLDLYRKLEEQGYRCISIEPAFIDARTFEVLQVDAIFTR